MVTIFHWFNSLIIINCLGLRVSKKLLKRANWYWTRIAYPAFLPGKTMDAWYFIFGVGEDDSYIVYLTMYLLAFTGSAVSSCVSWSNNAVYWRIYVDIIIRKSWFWGWTLLILFCFKYVLQVKRGVHCGHETRFNNWDYSRLTF